MRKVYCFLEKQENMGGALEIFLEELDALGFDINLYTNLDDRLNDPYYIISEIDKTLRKDENCPCDFMTDIPELMQIVYRLYQQIFDRFLYYESTAASEYKLHEIFEVVNSMPVMQNEQLHKPVYTNDISRLNKYFTYPSEKLQKYVSAACEAPDHVLFPLIRKYYKINDCYYLFEPILTESKIIIDASQKDTLNHNTETGRFVFRGFAKQQYMYDYDGELLNRLFYAIDTISNDNILEIYQLLDQLKDRMNYYSPFVFNMTCCLLDDAAQLDNKYDIIRSLLLLSFLMQVTKKSHYLNAFINNTLNNDILTCENRFFIWNQCKRYMWVHKVQADAATGELMKQLYNAAFAGFQENVSKELVPIPKEERDPDTIVVLAIQFLSERHAPTRTTLERCYTIAKNLGKRLLLINTREQYTRVGELVIYDPTFGNVIEDYSKLSSYQYKDLVIPFYQPGVNMPSVPEIKKILNKIREWKPSFIFSIGDGSMAADLCGKLVPQAAISVVFSTLATTKAVFSVIGRTIAEAEWDKLIKAGYQKNNIIESTFTFELNPRIRTISRKDMSLPEDAFLLAVIGIRLDSEIDDTFIEMVETTFSWGTHLVLAGKFERYTYYCEKYPEFKKHSTFIGYYDDILALMEICDLYINPRRQGGGFSIIEAFHEGKPGITLRYGDVAVSGGEDFCVQDYDEMVRLIRRYMDDKEFYAAMAEKAKEREKVVTDSMGAMKRIIERIQNNPLFF